MIELTRLVDVAEFKIEEGQIYRQDKTGELRLLVKNMVTYTFNLLDYDKHQLVFEDIKEEDLRKKYTFLGTVKGYEIKYT